MVKEHPTDKGQEVQKDMVRYTEEVFFFVCHGCKGTNIYASETVLRFLNSWEK